MPLILRCGEEADSSYIFLLIYQGTIRSISSHFYIYDADSYWCIWVLQLQPSVKYSMEMSYRHIRARS